MKVNSLKLKNLICSLAFAVLFFTGAAQFAVADAKDELSGTWQGNLSGIPFQIEVWKANNQWNASLLIQGSAENLEILGWKESFNGFYFFRPSDAACLSMYSENGTTYLTYFEKDNVRKVVLARKK